MLDKHKFIKFKKCLPPIGRVGGIMGNICQIYIYVNLLYYLFTFIECLVYKFMKFAKMINLFSEPEIIKLKFKKIIFS